MSDVAIAQAHQLEPISAIAERAGVPEDALIPFGKTKAKIDVAKLPERSQGKLVLVTGISPTPAGEGKSTVLIGLADALSQRGKKTVVALREPSLGPVMGIKGGAAGGGYSQVVPMEDINLHFTGDFHAITSATNTLATILDNHIHQGNKLNIDPRRITWKRCLDVNDRSLRRVITGLGGPASGTPQEAGFTITAASEIMAVLCLSRDLADFKERVARIVVAQTYNQEPVTAGDLGAAGALTALMRDALNPNLVQTLGGTPAIVHGGPFANIAHGCNSLIATRTALNLGDVVVTEAGFGSDLGAEKFFDIKCRFSGLEPAAAVIVATIRSLKHNGGGNLTDGLVNLERHVGNIRGFGIDPVVALNAFTADTDAERAEMAQWAKDHDVTLIDADVWAKGGEGGLELADAVMSRIDSGEANFAPIYDPADGIEASLQTVATKVYGAERVELSDAAHKDLAFLEAHGWDKLPVCISKTQYSFSDDPKTLGAPTGHTLHVRQLIPRIGAGFVVALTGAVMEMPGLGKTPAAYNIDVDQSGAITGLF